jgi:hypothetical protein
MKYFILIITLYYLYTIIYSIIHIKKIQTLKQVVDKIFTSPQFKKETDINKRCDYLVLTYIIMSVIVILFLILSAIYVGTFIFTVITFIYILWSLYDVNSSIEYINNKKQSNTSNINDKMNAVLNNMIDKLNSNITQSSIDTQLEETIEEYKMPKTFDSKLYKILSIPFDLGFALYVIYIIFTRWI